MSLFTTIMDLSNEYTMNSCKSPTQITMTFETYKRFCGECLLGHIPDMECLGPTSEQFNVFPTEILGMKIVLVSQGGMAVSGNASIDFEMWLSENSKRKVM